MKVNSELVRKLRTNKHWSQEELATVCSLNLRTVQRIENRGTGALESVKALASVFEVDIKDLLVGDDPQESTHIAIILSGFRRYADFSGVSSRPHYWWFFLFTLLITALGTVINPIVGKAILLVLLVPLLAVGCRRLRDAGHSGWWQLLFLVPFAFIIVFWLLSQPSKNSGQNFD